MSSAARRSTLHQLRHFALTHAAEDGANISTVLSCSGHTSLASLARYARVSPEALGRRQQQCAPRHPPSVRRLAPASSISFVSRSSRPVPEEHRGRHARAAPGGPGCRHDGDGPAIR
ncbi:MAG: tyrosine-type recombinase/integrase [Pseudonocardiaceae bacterium]